jgi:hypothetical protein
MANLGAYLLPVMLLPSFLWLADGDFGLTSSVLAQDGWRSREGHVCIQVERGRLVAMTRFS